MNGLFQARQCSIEILLELGVFAREVVRDPLVEIALRKLCEVLAENADDMALQRNALVAFALRATAFTLGS